MNTSDESTTQLGLWLYLMTDCLVFASLFATYAVLLPGTAGGPGPSDLFDPSFIAVSTIVLLTSTLTAGLALIAAKAGSRTRTTTLLLITAMLGALFIGMELYEFSHILGEGFSWQTSAFLSAFFSLVGLHGGHILVGLLWVVVLLVAIAKKGLSPKNLRSLGLFTLFWHFLDLVWIFIFTFVYMAGVVA